MVLTEHPLREFLRKADLFNRITKWDVELANFDIKFQPRMTVKAQVLADFVSEFSSGSAPSDELTDRSFNRISFLTASSSTPPPLGLLKGPTPRSKIAWHLLHSGTWMLHVDVASNSRGSGAGIVPVSLDGVIHEHALTINYPASNNEEEYEALIAGLRLANLAGAEEPIVYSDSQLAVNQLTGEYGASDDRMLKYHSSTLHENHNFQAIPIEQIGREQNSHVDALA